MYIYVGSIRTYIVIQYRDIVNYLLVVMHYKLISVERPDVALQSKCQIVLSAELVTVQLVQLE